jgi:hypothetical protein
MAISPQGWRDLKALPRLVKELILNATEEERVDVLGEVRFVEKAVAAERQMAMSEIHRGAEGQDWYVKQPRACTRSYNDSALLLKVADAKGMTLMQTIGFLLQNNVLVFEWKWTNLKELVRELKLETTIVQREIIAGDQADIFFLKGPCVDKEIYPSMSDQRKMITALRANIEIIQ